MFDKPQATHTLGLDIDGLTLNGVALSIFRGKPKFDFSFEYPLELDTASEITNSYSADVNPLYTEDQKNELKELSASHLTVTAMNGQEVLIRQLEMKVKKDKDIEDVLAFQAEPVLPYPTENAILDKIILSKDANSSKITLFSVRKDRLKEHIKQWNTLDIEPEVITAAAHALCLFSENFTKIDEPYYILHLGWSQTLLVLIDQKKVIASQAIDASAGHLAAILAKNESIDLNTARFRLHHFQPSTLPQNPKIKEAVQELRLAITRTIYSLAKQIRGKEVNNLLITGPGAVIQLSLHENLANIFSASLNKTLVPVEDDVSFGMNSKDLKLFALPIGQAISALPITKEQINFRQGDSSYPAPWKRLKVPISIYMSLCIGVAIALAIFGKSYVSYQEAHIKLQFLELLAGMNRPYGDFEKEFSTKTKSFKDTSLSDAEFVKTLSQDEIKNRLQYLEKEIQAIPLIFPLRPNIPLVSDVLSWLSTHPSFSLKVDANQTGLQIESLSYVMVKRPEPTKKNEKYQVKIDLEFSSATPKPAREFHDALIAPNEMVDPKGEIKWNASKDHYRTSFYLKDKTSYQNQ